MTRVNCATILFVWVRKDYRPRDCLAASRTQPSVSLSRGCVQFSTQPLIYCSEISCLAKPKFPHFSKTKWRCFANADQQAVVSGEIIHSRTNQDDLETGALLAALVPFLCSCWFVYIVHIKVTSSSLRSLFCPDSPDIPLHQSWLKSCLYCVWNYFFFPQSKLLINWIPVDWD